MATQITYTGDGSTAVFNVPFDYLLRSHVFAFVDGITAEYEFTSSSTIEITPVPPQGAVVRIVRVTQLTPIVDFQNGETLTEANLDRISMQSLFLAEESEDLRQDTLQVSPDDTWDAQLKRMKNLGDPVLAQDAATKVWVETALQSPVVAAQESASVAAAAAVAAAEHEEAADQDRIAAAAHQDAALNHRDSARIARDQSQNWRNAAQAFSEQALIFRDSAAAHGQQALAFRDQARTAKDQAEQIRLLVDDKAEEIGSISAIISTLTTGTPATVGYNSSTGVLSFGIPEGPQGIKGDKGDKGDVGEAGVDGVDGYGSPQEYGDLDLVPMGVTFWCLQTALNKPTDDISTRYSGLTVQESNGNRGYMLAFGGGEVFIRSKLPDPVGWGEWDPLRGIQGIQGLKGDKGDQGDQGVQGIQGIQGLKGDKGDTGSQGVRGDKGDTGARGLQGLKGDKGDTGADGTSVSIKGEVPTIADLPSSGNTEGDGYIVGENLHVWSGTAWSAGMQIRGPQGIQGIQGPQGDQGPKGDKGDQGDIGPKGDKGDRGEDGLGAQSFGLGDTTGSSITMGDLDDVSTPTGFYRTTPSTLNIANRPAGETDYGSLQMYRYDQDDVIQVYTPVVGDKGSFERTSRNGVWSGWSLKATSANIKLFGGPDGLSDFTAPEPCSNFNDVPMGVPFWAYAGTTNAPVSGSDHWSGITLKGFNGNNGQMLAFGGGETYARSYSALSWGEWQKLGESVTAPDRITVSTLPPSGGVDGDVWFTVPA